MRHNMRGHKFLIGPVFCRPKTYTHRTIATGALLIAVLCIACTGAVGDDRIGVLVMREPESAQVQDRCSGVSSIQVQVLKNLHINGKSEVRTLDPHQLGARTVVSRKEYDHARSVKIADLGTLQFNNEIMYAINSSDQTLVVLPQGLKLDKISGTEIKTVYHVALEGDAVEKGVKKRQNLQLSEVLKIFVVAADHVQDAMFEHAAEENAPAVWKAYMGTAGNYRSSEALAGLRDSLQRCAQDALTQYESGDFHSLELAKGFALEASGVDGGPATVQLVANIQSAEDSFHKQLDDAKALMTQGKWDAVLDALRPIAKYASQVPALKEVDDLAINKSFDLHMAAAAADVSSGKLEDAVHEYDISLQRKPNSLPATQARNDVRIRIGLRDSKRLRAQHQAGKATTELQELAADPGLASDSRLVAELHAAGCEYGTQLSTEAKRLAFSPGTNRLILITTKKSRANLRDAQQKLATATDLCGNPTASGLLSRVNRALADDHLQSAKRTLASGLVGTALLHAQAANKYVPSVADGLLPELKSRVDQKTQVRVGITFRSVGGDPNCVPLVSMLNDNVRQSLSASFTFVSEEEATALLGNRSGSSSPFVIVVGTASSCRISRHEDTQNVPSRYQEQNSDYDNAQQAVQVADQQFKDCKRTYGEAGCGGAKSNLDSAHTRLKSTPQWSKHDYSYVQKVYSAIGDVRLNLQVVEASSSKAPDQVTLSVQDSCSEKEGFRDDDEGQSGWLGSVSTALNALADAKLKRVSCPLESDSEYYARMLTEVTTKSDTAIKSGVSSFPQDMLAKAERSTNEDTKIEDYALYILSNPGEGADLNAAVSKLRAITEDLQPSIAVSKTVPPRDGLDSKR